MKVLLVSPGKLHDHTVAAGIAEYETRLLRHYQIEWVHPKAGDIESECDAILKYIKDGDQVVLLDELGKDIDTPAFAAFIDKHQQSGTKRLVFIIGGAYGVNGRVKARANATLKLSSLVLPHMLVRLLLVEQLYRAHSILSSGKYHHD
jgi:23S rRNA (pseudouridine1915-N3)-methyltransferase